MNIGEICTRDIVSVPPSAALAQVARQMHDKHVGAVIVTKAPMDGPVAIGIITDRDIVRAQLDHGADLFCLGAEQVMTRDPLVLEEHLSLAEGIERMRRRGVRRAVVVGPHEQLAGVISVDDILAELARELASLARLIEVQPKREAA